MVIFGASGDLTARKLIPALYSLHKNGLLNNNFFVLGAARTEMDDASFRDALKSSAKASRNFDEQSWSDFVRRVHYRRLDYSSPGAYEGLAGALKDLELEYMTSGARLFYLSTPPGIYEEIIGKIAASALSDTGLAWRRIVVEKPFGRDLSSARSLDRLLHDGFRESEIYRIDHYLGKETVQNIVMLRFANAIFEPIWNRRYIDHIQITVAEGLGVERRAGFYDSAGVLRDMFQNHMLQVLSLAAMEPPSSFVSSEVRDEKTKVLRALKPLPLDWLSDFIVLGQYADGEVNGKRVSGYMEEPGVAMSSNTPTFAAMKLHIDNWRWNGVPFYLRSGKRLAKRVTEVAIQFKQVPHMMFRGMVEGEVGPNVLILRIQPDERVQLTFHTKRPGTRLGLRDVLMDFSYTDGYTGIFLDAYERMLMDAMLGDDMLFLRSDAVELSWSFFTPILERIEEAGGDGKMPGAPKLFLYRSGSWGPPEADIFMERDGRRWRCYD
jgi:glucose-6-phosphate 1-dehydrogenase